MTKDLTHRLAIYPMVEEADAVGVVAAVYGRILSRMPLVPSLFKSFAVCPAYLVLAWRQADAVFDREDFGDRAERLRASVAREVTPPQDGEVRDTVGRFVEPLARMLLLSGGLHLALDGGLEARSAPRQARSDRAAKRRRARRASRRGSCRRRPERQLREVAQAVLAASREPGVRKALACPSARIRPTRWCTAGGGVPALVEKELGVRVPGR